MKMVLDEWLWADLKGENQSDQQKESFIFLQTIFDRCDQIVTAQDSSFIHKFWNFSKTARDQVHRKILKMFKFCFYGNSEKLQQLDESDLRSVPEEMRCSVEESDHYLIQTYMSAGADILITTDQPLIQVLSDHGIRCCHRNDFVPAYIESG